MYRDVCVRIRTDLYDTCVVEYEHDASHWRRLTSKESATRGDPPIRVRGSRTHSIWPDLYGRARRFFATLNFVLFYVLYYQFLHYNIVMLYKFYCYIIILYIGSWILLKKLRAVQFISSTLLESEESGEKTSSELVCRNALIKLLCPRQARFKP